MLLNLGCGGDRKEGFVNVDIAGGDVVRDLRHGIYPHVATQNSVDFIYTSHFLEHIFDSEAAFLLKDCHTVLKPGGRVRICVPDFKKLIEAYMKGDREFFSLLPGDPQSLISYLEYCAYQYSGKENDHKALYDFDKVRKLLSEAGFVGVKECQFDPELDVDSEDRRRYSVYVEGNKKNEYPTFMGKKNVLFALTVHNRLPELRLQETLIRNEFGKTVGIHVFCNCPAADASMYQDLLEDGFHWTENTGHSQGALDHPNMVVEVAWAFDYVVLMAAKTLWTDYSLISRVIEDMASSGKQVAVFNDEGRGHFNDTSNYAFFCDFMVFTSDLYRKVFPVYLGEVDKPEGFPETAITNKVLELVGGKGNVFYVPCKPGNAVDNFVFTEVYGTNNSAISTRNLDLKLTQLSDKNSRYKKIYDKLLRSS